MRSRSGFTLPELMVAIMIITVGVLALASSSAGTLKQMRAGNTATLAAMAAQSRMETIRSMGCNSISSGSATTRGMSEVWAVSSISAKIYAVRETVTYTPRAGATSKVGVWAVVPCK
jgi:prepilin-type N-terminal cleavage/methylation domain-containing protein